MSIILYDNSIVEDLKNKFNDDRIKIMHNDVAFDTMGRLQEDQIKFPMITLNRIGWSLQDNHPHGLRFQGAELYYDKESTIHSRLQALPIEIRYELDVWTKYREENDNILREILFYYSTNPTLIVKIPYKLDQEHHFNIFLGNNVIDNSVTRTKDTIEYKRQTVNIITNDAYLWRSQFKKDVKLELELVNKNDGSIISKDKFPLEDEERS